MPPGPKKRRAAKKKKGNQSYNHSNPSSASAHSHGDEFVKNHGEKDPDVGEVSSPVSQDHHNHHNPSTDVEEEEIEKKNNFPNLTSTEGSKINEGKSDGNNGKVVEIDEAISSSSYSSDDEVHGIKNSRATEDISSASIHSVPIEEVKQAKVESLLEGNEKKPSCVQSVEKTATILDEEVFAIQESNDRLRLPYNEPRGADENRAEQENECSVTEPLLVTSPCPEKRASWKSCCGLFEVFSESGR